MLSFALLLCAAASSGFAAQINTSNVRFRTFGIDDGLSQSTVRAIAQDRSGLMWFGTQDGLNRFDGYEFRSFFRDSEATGAISDNHILSLAADDANSGLWIGTQSRGLNFLDLRTERFRTFRAGEMGFNSDEIRGLALKPDGNLWLATNVGVALFATKTERILEQTAVANVNSVTLDLQAEPVITSDGGLMRRINGKMSRWPDEVWTYGPAQVATMDRDGDVWVGLTSDGLLHFDRSGMLVERFRAASTCEDPPLCARYRDTLPGNEVRALLLTQSGELWVSTLTGSAYYDRSAGHFVRFMHDPTNADSPPADRAHTLFEDHAHQIWVGTWRAGVAVHNPLIRSVYLTRHREEANLLSGSTARTESKFSLPANPVLAILREPDRSVWLGVLEGGGLIHYDFNLGVLARYSFDANNAKSLASNTVAKIVRRRNGELWVATLGGGINQLGSDGQFTRYGTREPEPYRLNGDRIIALFEDRDGSLWAGSDSGGLLLRCPSCTAFVPFLDRSGVPMPPSINAIFRDKNGTLWIGAQAKGLVAINSETRQIRSFRNELNDPNSLCHDTVTSLFETSGGELWLGTQGGGVAHVTIDGDAFTGSVRFQAVRKADGIGSDAIGAILEDEVGNLWVSSTVGIAMLDVKTMKARSLTETDGVDRSGYYIGAGAKDVDGSLMFGGLGGLIRFNPLDLPQKPALQKPVLTGMRLLNAPLKLSWQQPETGSVIGASPLTVAAPFATKLALSYLQNMYSVEFSALNFGHANATEYQYRLIGTNEAWVRTAPGQRSATFTNLAAGSYQFEVQTRSGSFTSEAAGLTLVIAPAPWLSIWAKLGYLCATLIGGGLVFGYARRRVNEKLRDAARVERSEAQLKHALWGSRDELWDLDLRTGKVQAVNPLPELKRERLNRPDKPIDLDDLVKIAHPADRARFKLALTAHVDEGTEYFEAAFRMRTLFEEWAWVMGRGRAIERDANGRAVRLVGTLRDISDVKAVEDELRSVNERLEDRVIERTLALSVSNTELSATLDTLKATQRQLVDSEKMASLGNLVAGVAHEINTPLGIGVTAASHLRQETERLARHLEKNTLSKIELEQFTKSAVEASDLVLKNLDRASKLVRSFKQVAVDQGSEALRTIVLINYLEEVLFTLKPTLKRTQHKVTLDVPPLLALETYPGALSQIIFNLVTNTLTHAFPERNDGQIRIHANLVDAESSASNRLICLRYQDDGVGMAENVRKRIFEPFFTTKRGQGGSGLGMHVVYNLVTQLLKGDIQCISAPDAGTEIVIQIPMRSV